MLESCAGQKTKVRVHKMDKKILSHTEVAFQEIAQELGDNSVKEQYRRLLETFKRFSVNTFETSRYLINIYDPLVRSFQLRAQNQQIKTSWHTIEAEISGRHHVGCYALNNEADNE